jgi:hypothetical protein
VPPPASWDLYRLEPGGTAPTYLQTLQDAFGQSCVVDLLGPGSGQFSIGKTSAEVVSLAGVADDSEDLLVRVRWPEIGTAHHFGFFLETVNGVLVDEREEGGEVLTFGGRGLLAYLEFAKAWSESFITGGQDPFDNLWRAYLAGTGSKPGQILMRAIEEATHPSRPYQPLPLLVVDFDYDVDSNGDTWLESDATNEFTYQVGESLLSIAQRLVDTGTLILVMDPDFTLHAYNASTYGADLAGDAFGPGVVRFEKGVNLRARLEREQRKHEASTVMLVSGEKDSYAYAATADVATRVVKEGFVTTFGTVGTTLQGVGAAELAKRDDDGHEFSFGIVPVASSDPNLLEGS